MAGIVRIRLQINGLQELRQRAIAHPFLAMAWCQAMEQMGRSALDAARAAAPVGPSYTGHIGGQTSAKLRMRMQATPVPLWVRVETTAVRPWGGHGNYSYAKRVEWDPKLRHLHWFAIAFGRAKGQFESVLKRAADTVEHGLAGH